MCKNKLFFMVILAMILILSSGVYAKGVDIPDEIRIGLYYGSKGALSVELSSPGGITIGTLNGDEFEEIDYVGKNEKITITKGSSKGSVVVSGIGKIGDSENVPYFISEKDSNKEHIVSVNGTKYRGDIEIKRYSDSDMTVINVLSMQEYLYGVVPREIGGNSSYEAVKAQAIIARTYAAKNYNKRMKWGFNLYPTVDDQAYGGYTWENVNSNRAVDETEGQVATYEGELINGYYFSTSGGCTENSENVWGGKLDYLKAVADPYEPDNLSKTSWTVELTASEIKSRLANYGVDVGDVLDIEPTKLSETGRVIELTIYGTEGTKVITKSNTRTYLGLDSQWYTVNSEAPKVAKIITEDTKPSKKVEDDFDEEEIIPVKEEKKELKPLLKKFTDILRGEKTETEEVNSTYYASKKVNNKFVIQGRGWGHAVGMSQNGAKGMAENGFSCEEIIKWYYTGVEITD